MYLRVLGSVGLAKVKTSLLGPIDSTDSYRYKLTVKCRNDRRFRDLIRETLTLYEQEKLPGKATVVVDLHSDGDI